MKTQGQSVQNPWTWIGPKESEEKGQGSPHPQAAARGMTVDARGFLWVERYGGVGADPPEFDIFDPEGRRVGLAALPEDAEILEIGDDYILALFRDELGIGYVRRYGLQRPAGS